MAGSREPVSEWVDPESQGVSGRTQRASELLGGPGEPESEWLDPGSQGAIVKIV
mgnify:CR=1 FL=1